MLNSKVIYLLRQNLNNTCRYKLYSSGFLLLLFTLHQSQAQGFTEIGDTLGVSYDFVTEEYGGGLSFVDFNQDGLDDLTFATHAGQPVRFHLNNGNGFTEITPLINDSTEVKQVLWVDYNNDGQLDLYITSADQNRLYKNTGHLNLVDITATCGFDDPLLISYCASWFDFNSDGLLDLAVPHRTEDTAGHITLYKNLGNDLFEDVTIKAGLKDKGNSVLSMTTFDFNNDGWDDLFLAQDHEAGNQLLRNNGNGTFTDISNLSGTNQRMNSMTATVGDYDQDGWFDIYVSNTREGNILLRNNQDETFTEISVAMGVHVRSLTFGSIFFDADNDMDQDLQVVGAQVNYMFENPSDGLPFQRVDNEWGFEKDKSFNNGAAIGDFNSDGYPDVAKSSLTLENFLQGRNTFWRNDFSANNYLTIDLEGTVSNRNAIGAVIEIRTDDLTQIRRIACGESYSSQHSLSQFIGLGSHDQVDEITIRWPSGSSTREFNIAANQRIRFVEPRAGCADPLACNYMPGVSPDNTLCRYANTFYDCDGCQNDRDEDGVCDELEVAGCTDYFACNFDLKATDTNGSCLYLPVFEIVGNESVIPMTTEQYSYPHTDGSSYEWSIENGRITLGQGLSTIRAVWLNGGSGEISVVETNSNCISTKVTKQVTALVLGLNSLMDDFQIYPNPTSKLVTIHMSGREDPGVVTIFNASGQSLLSARIKQEITVLDISSFPDGIYIVTLKTNEVVRSKKIVIRN